MAQEGINLFHGSFFKNSGSVTLGSLLSRCLFWRGVLIYELKHSYFLKYYNSESFVISYSYILHTVIN